eukprot:gnl/Trimastix_PCT/2902.p1 GENE.gnl/Trimastix_PCT/2902~~gnl/Trimastix_PCT/2902.p1  ORF type:complete len:102 (+),score=3.28 gnl/Trimastix_PCT/2902:62-367(+)
MSFPLSDQSQQQKSYKMRARLRKKIHDYNERINGINSQIHDIRQGDQEYLANIQSLKATQESLVLEAARRQKQPLYELAFIPTGKILPSETQPAQPAPSIR